MAIAIDVAAAVQASGSWRLALRDVHAAYLAAGSDDSFVFAYRAIEDLARAVSPTKNKDWPRLQAHLGLTEYQLKRRTRSLMAARDCVAHGDLDSPTLAGARRDGSRRIGVARSLVRLAFANEPALPSV